MSIYFLSLIFIYLISLIKCIEDFSKFNNQKDKENTTEKYSDIKIEGSIQIDKDMNLNYTDECALGNLISNIVREATGADIAIIPSAAFKSNWTKGILQESDIEKMLNDSFVFFDMNGKEIKRMLQVFHNPKEIFQASGIIQVLKKVDDKIELIDVRLFDGVETLEIDPISLYRIITTENLFNEFFNGWFEERRRQTIGTPIKIVEEYLLSMGNIKVDSLVDKNNKRVFYLP